MCGRVPAASQDRLGDEGFFVLQPPLRLFELRPVFGAVYALERFLGAHETMALADVGGQHIGKVADLVEHDLDRLRDLPRSEFGGGRVDRNHRPGETGSLLVAAEDLELRMGQLQVAAIGVDLAREESLDALVHGLGQPALVEEGQQQTSGAVGDDHLGAHAAAVLEPVVLRAQDPGDDRDVLTLTQCRQIRERAAVEVAARVVVEQVADGLQLELLLQRVGRTRAELALEAGRQVDAHVRVTPLPTASGSGSDRLRTRLCRRRGVRRATAHAARRRDRRGNPRHTPP